MTALQAYRDLFAAEALRAGEPISVGTLTVVFTDLRGSTRYYRETGDAPAFGIHTGPCIAVSQNGVLDYFGSTVNLAARLVSLSSGEDIVVSDAVLADPEVAALGLRAEALEAGVLKGFEDEALSLWRVSA